MPRELDTAWRAALASETKPASQRKQTPEEAWHPALTVLWHPDTRRVGDRVMLDRLARSRQQGISRLEPLFDSDDFAPAPLADPHLSRQPVLLIASGADHLELDPTGSSIALEVDGQTQSDSRRISVDDLERGLVLELSGRVVLLLHRLPATPRIGLPDFGLVGESPSMAALRSDIDRAAATDLPVLLRGESGTGKELVARAIHGPGSPFVPVNLGAVPSTLAASELFGAVRGAFTGATQARDGFFRRADGGTLFLDEVGEMPEDVQPLLLRALESGEIQPVGASQPRSVRVRVIAATDANLEQAVSDGQFRAPLYHRLASYTIALPPLRERRDDIGRLMLHFLRHELRRQGKMVLLAPAGPDGRPWLPASVVARLARYDWPGNVRQLNNVARRLTAECAGMTEARLSPAIESQLILMESSIPSGNSTEAATASANQAPPKKRPKYRSADEIGEEELLEVMARHDYRPGPAAQELGVARGSLYARIESSPNLCKGADLSSTDVEHALKASDGDITEAARTLRVSSASLVRRRRQLGLDE